MKRYLHILLYTFHVIDKFILQLQMVNALVGRFNEMVYNKYHTRAIVGIEQIPLFFLFPVFLKLFINFEQQK